MTFHDLNLGSPVWVFDPNRRVYSKQDRGGPIWREHFRKLEVIGETRVSWIIGNHNGRREECKIPKRGFDTKCECNRFAFSEKELDQRQWMEENRHRIADSVREMNAWADYDALIEIERLVKKDTL